MADDQQNPFTMMGMMQMMQPNKYIDPAYKDKSLPMPGFYTGVAGNTPPTDASGKPIQDFVDYNNIAQGQYQKQLADYNSQPKPAPGTTLNSTPQPGLSAYDQRLQGGSGSMMQGGAGLGPTGLGNAQDPAVQARINPGPSAYYAPGNSGSSNQYQQTPLTPFANAPTGPSGSQAAAPAAGAAPPSPPDLRQAYLNALSNPGPVTTPGATVAQSAPLGQPSVLDSFLSANKAGPAAPVGGGYSNAGFFSTLNKLRAGQ